MAKAMNIVFGVGIAILLYIVVLLGIGAFYPEPDFDDYDCKPIEPKSIGFCTDDMTVAECNSLRNLDTLEDREKLDECHEEYQNSRDIYNRNFFIITNVIGLVFLITSVYIFTMLNISVGIASAGLALIFFGFIIGWESTQDTLKFIVGLLITIIVVYFAVKINKKGHKRKKKK